MPKKHLKKSRLVWTMLLTVGVIVAADSIRRDFFVTPDTTIVISGDFKDPMSAAQTTNDGTVIAEGTTQQSSQDISYLGYSELAVPASQLSSGLLTVANQQYPLAASDDSSSLVSLLDVKNECYSLYAESLMLNEDAADALNLMMADYNSAMELSDFVIYSTTQQNSSDDSLYSASFEESAGGFTVDLAVQGANRILEYDVLDEESWIIENCASYGFIVRYPDDKESVTGQSGCVWHLRYVGRVHASIMEQNNLCLEKYNDWLKSYTIDTETLVYELDGVQYEIYYTAYMGDSTSVRVPVSGNYTISGNNIDGFVVTAVK